MTFGKCAVTSILVCIAAPYLHADFSYEQTTKITGGAMVSAMKFAGAFSKDARKAMDPVKSTTSIKGNRMVHRTADSASIIDLDKETITQINYAKKTYSVATFAQIKQAMDDMSQKMREQKAKSENASPGEQVDMHFDVKVNDTGQTKLINGNDAHQMIMTITMQGADAKSGTKGGIDVTTDMWIAPQVAGYQEVRDFYRRMSEKLEWTPGANPIMMSRPDMARAMAQLYKEGSKLNGMPVYETIKMGGKMEGPPGASASQSQSQASPDSSGHDSAPAPASVSGALGAALGGRLGLGGFGHKKKQAPADSDTSASPASSNTGSTTGSNSASGSLMEMTTEVMSYSSAPADPSGFEIPSGFLQVQQEPLHSKPSSSE
jgi:hypothetical protein